MTNIFEVNKKKANNMPVSKFLDKIERLIKVTILTKNKGIVNIWVDPNKDINELNKELTEKYITFIQI